jgi:hypothetical protein
VWVGESGAKTTCFGWTRKRRGRAGVPPPRWGLFLAESFFSLETYREEAGRENQPRKFGYQVGRGVNRAQTIFYTVSRGSPARNVLPGVNGAR